MATISGPRSTLTVIVETYAKIISYYSRVATTANVAVPDLVFAESCLKISRVLTTAYLNDGWNDRTMALLVQGQLRSEKKESTSSSPMFLTMSHLVAHKQSGIPRYDIADWVTKIWEIQMDELALLDQINLTSSMALIYSSIGYHRKSAWLMHETVERMLPLLIQYRRTGTVGKEGKLGSIPIHHDQGVLEILKRMCEIYGIGERNVHDGGALEAMRQEDQDQWVKNKSNHPKYAPQGTERKFGWAELQMVILKQCISVSDALMDNGSRLYYTTVLLKNLYQSIPKAEQIRLATTIQGMVAIQSAYKKSSTPIVSGKINYWGVNIVSRVEAKKPISRKAVYSHPIKNEAMHEKNQMENPEDADPFIYNPFAKKADTTVIFV